MADDRWWKSFDAVVAKAIPPGSRILDLGCGDGGLVERLTELGYDALGVDPAAPANDRLIRQRMEDVEGLGLEPLCC
jgi:2-polyprenyl-3-methyl-5-hydroxy-6-metoxy-1,4-benzoquinol methylase